MTKYMVLHTRLSHFQYLGHSQAQNEVRAQPSEQIENWS